MSKSVRVYKSGGKGIFLKISAVVLMLIMLLSMGMMSVFAAGDEDDQALSELSTGVAQELASNSYKVEGGGSLNGSDLFVQDESYDKVNVQTIDEKNFNKLTSSAQSELVSDIAEKSNEYADDDKAHKSVTDDTVQNWWKQLQTKKGAGSKFLNVILENTKPDFVKANQIYAPFSGIIGTIMGIIAVVGMGLLGIVLVADIFYIVIPPVRMMVAEEGGQPGEGRGSRTGKSKLFSDDALYAVKIAEESSDGGGSKKQALGVYLKRRIPMLILLGICLMYLVSGSIYTLVGYVLDLVSGFIGF